MPEGAVYLRHTTVRKNGKVHIYWCLVRSVRQGTKVRQETVAYLGELDAQGRLKAKTLADQIVGRHAQPELWEDTSSLSSARVELKGIRVERGRQFGDVWLGWMLWRALGLDELLGELIPDGREDIPWAVMASVLVMARLCEPSSE